MKIDNAIVIAFLCALLNLIPYVGPLVSAVLMILLSMTTNIEANFSEVTLPNTIGVLIFFFIAQLIDNFVSRWKGIGAGLWTNLAKLPLGHSPSCRLRITIQLSVQYRINGDISYTGFRFANRFGRSERPGHHFLHGEVVQYVAQLLGHMQPLASTEQHSHKTR